MPTQHIAIFTLPSSLEGPRLSSEEKEGFSVAARAVASRLLVKHPKVQLHQVITGDDLDPERTFAELAEKTNGVFQKIYILGHSNNHFINYPTVGRKSPEQFADDLFHKSGLKNTLNTHLSEQLVKDNWYAPPFEVCVRFLGCFTGYSQPVKPFQHSGSLDNLTLGDHSSFALRFAAQLAGLCRQTLIETRQSIQQNNPNALPPKAQSFNIRFRIKAPRAFSFTLKSGQNLSYLIDFRKAPAVDKTLRKNYHRITSKEDAYKTKEYDWLLPESEKDQTVLLVLEKTKGSKPEFSLLAD